MADKENAARELLSCFLEKGLTFAAAESCTGGMIGETVTALPGSSQVFLGGVVSYANSVKENVLGVKGDTLARHGAVSRETALEMAEGVRRLTGADIAVSVTGIAGPGGGTAEKPVGTVCFGVSDRRGTETVRVQFDPALTREEIRCAAAEYALAFALSRVNGDK